MEAVKNKAIILKYASKELREDKEIAIAALKQNKKAKSYICENLLKDEEIQNILNPGQGDGSLVYNSKKVN